MSRHRVMVEIDTETDRFGVWKDGLGWVEVDLSPAFVTIDPERLRGTVVGLNCAIVMPEKWDGRDPFDAIADEYAAPRRDR